MISKALEEILASLDPIDLEPGDILIRQGDFSDAAYFLVTGPMLVYRESPYGSVPLATIEGPTLIGEIGALGGLARTASIKAIASTRVFRIGRTKLLELGHKSPDLLVSVIKQLGEEIESVNRAIALYTNALAALERREFDQAILAELANPPPQLREFSEVFRRFARQITEKRRQEEETASAALIQQSFLPKEPFSKAIGSKIEIRAKMRPARDVGGDFYDYFMLDDDRLAVIIGDVCGKGMPASLFMAVVVTTLRTAARDERDPAATIARANVLLCRDNAASLFATLFYAVVRLGTGAVEYCNCGHNAPVHLSATGEPRRLAATGLPVALYEDRSATASSFQLNPGDELILFTDGVTEAINSSEAEFGEPLLIETLLSERHRTPAELVSRIFAAVDDFAEGQQQADDITCLVLRRPAQTI